MLGLRQLGILTIVLVTLSVACAELPELFSICDDVSNDFVLNSADSYHFSLQSAVKQITSKVLETNSAVFIWELQSAFNLQVLPRTRSGREVLAQHSLQKK